ncbi:MAG: hypothetical protein SGPRY_008740, partial [Prymnesium sp.]
MHLPRLSLLLAWLASGSCLRCFPPPAREVRAHAVMASQPQPAAPKPMERSYGLALALDEGTRKSHSMAENTAFVTGFFKGISTRPAFSQLVADLYFVYKAM